MTDYTKDPIIHLYWTSPHPKLIQISTKLTTNIDTNHLRVIDLSIKIYTVEAMPMLQTRTHLFIIVNMY